MCYKCFEFEAEDTASLVKEFSSIQKVRYIRLKEVLQSHRPKGAFISENSIEGFFNEYRRACDFKEYPKCHYEISNLRKSLCNHCIAIKCGACKKTVDFCKTCKKNPDYEKHNRKSVGGKCYLFQEFQKVKVFELNADENVLDPQAFCEKCYYCDVLDVGEEKVDLKDIPLDGYPTKVVIYRKIYRKGHTGCSPCPKKRLPGLQSSCNSNYTCRLHKAVTSGVIKGGSRPDLSEWYDISYNTLSSMIRRQAKAVEKRRSELRLHTDTDSIRALMASGDIGDEPCELYFMAPFSGKSRNYELVGIYSSKEISYLKYALMGNGDYERPSSLTNSRVFSMAFDFACQHFGQHLFGPPAVFANLMVMADLFYCNPIDVMRESFWALHFRMLQALKNNEPVSVLLDILRSLMRLIPNADKYSTINDAVRLAYDQVLELEGIGGDLSFSGVGYFNEEETKSILGITHMISECSKGVNMTFDEIRDRLLFVNQAVVPYHYNRDTGELAPMFSEDGLIDTSRVSSLGIRCSCLEILVGTGLLMDDTDASICCKEYSFQGKTWKDLEYRETCTCRTCECQNLYEEGTD